MANNYIDLHIHTTASDGLLTPEEVLAVARERGLRAISITDHDTTDGFSQFMEDPDANGIEIIPGVELSCIYKDNDVHMLAYYIDYKESGFVKNISKYRRERFNRGIKMVDKLNDIGININMETVKEIAGDGSVGRPHVAEALVREEYVRTLDEAFARYIGYHAPAYVPKSFLDVGEAIDIIHGIGGLAVLAHPGTLRHDEFIPDFVDLGLDGLEAYHSLHKNSMVEKYKKIAKVHGLFFSGGSDCHGPRKGKIIIGTPKVPYSCLESMQKALEKL